MVYQARDSVIMGHKSGNQSLQEFSFGTAGPPEGNAGIT